MSLAEAPPNTAHGAMLLGGGGFWPPLAVAIAGGVCGATILALYFAPSAYLLMLCRGGNDGE